MENRENLYEKVEKYRILIKKKDLKRILTKNRQKISKKIENEKNEKNYNAEISLTMINIEKATFLEKPKILENEISSLLEFFYKNPNPKNLSKKINFFISKNHSKKIISILKNFSNFENFEKIIIKITELLIILLTEKISVEEFFYLGLLKIYEEILEKSKNFEILENIIWGLGNSLINDSDNKIKKIYYEIFLDKKILKIIKFLYKKKNCENLFDSFVIFWSFFLGGDFLKFEKIENDFFLILEYFLYVNNDYKNLDEILSIIEKCFFLAFENDEFEKIFENFLYEKFLQKILKILKNENSQKKNKIQIFEILKIIFSSKSDHYQTVEILRKFQILKILEKNFENENLDFFLENSSFLNSLILFSDIFLEKIQIETKILENIFFEISKIKKNFFENKLNFLLTNLIFCYSSKNLSILNFYLKNEKTVEILVNLLSNKNSVKINKKIFEILRNIFDIGEISKNGHNYEGNKFIEKIKENSFLLEKFDRLCYNENEDVKKIVESILYYYFQDDEF